MRDGNGEGGSDKGKAVADAAVARKKVEELEANVLDEYQSELTALAGALGRYTPMKKDRSAHTEMQGIVTKLGQMVELRSGKARKLQLRLIQVKSVEVS